MFAIGTPENGRIRYVRDDSRPDMVWGTLDPSRAMAWETREEALDWTLTLDDERYDRLDSRPWRYVSLDPAPEEPREVACEPSFCPSAPATIAVAAAPPKPVFRADSPRLFDPHAA